MTSKSVTCFLIFGCVVLCSWFFVAVAHPVEEINSLSKSFRSSEKLQNDHIAVGNVKHRSKRQLDFFSQICSQVIKFFNQILNQIKKCIFRLVGGLFLGGGTNKTEPGDVKVTLPTDSSNNIDSNDENSSPAIETSSSIRAEVNGGSSQSSTLEGTSTSVEETTMESSLSSLSSSSSSSSSSISSSEASTELSLLSSSETTPESSSTSSSETTSETSSEASSTILSDASSEATSEATSETSSSSEKPVESTTTK
ncbi:hypothetical protein PGB90_008693 [Kerria lacca]